MFVVSELKTIIFLDVTWHMQEAETETEFNYKSKENIERKSLDWVSVKTMQNYDSFVSSWMWNIDIRCNLI